jgi:mRNA interferase HigB
MLIVGREKLDDFTGEHADARPWIANWVADTKLARWTTSQDIKDNYASASFLADNVVIFNVKGNRYRMEVKVLYGDGTVLIRQIRTHAEYSKRKK